MYLTRCLILGRSTLRLSMIWYGNLRRLFYYSCLALSFTASRVTSIGKSPWHPWIAHLGTLYIMWLLMIFPNNVDIPSKFFRFNKFLLFNFWWFWLSSLEMIEKYCKFFLKLGECLCILFRECWWFFFSSVQMEWLAECWCILLADCWCLVTNLYYIG